MSLDLGTEVIYDQGMMIDETNIPRYAMFRNRKVRIADYVDGKFRIVDTDDTTRYVTREQLRFIKEK